MKTKNTQHFIFRFLPRMIFKRQRAQRTRKSGVRVSPILFFVLFMFVSVHPWFRIPAFAAAQTASAGHTLTGIDVLESQKFAPLVGKRVGLITNQTGIDRNRRNTIDLLGLVPRGLPLVARMVLATGILFFAPSALLGMVSPLVV
jgi:hypothetical protein